MKGPADKLTPYLADKKLPECWFWAGWEPLRHYQRMGKSGSPFFGKGAWLKEWDKRKFSDDLIDEALNAGATVIITEFFKGFGRALEQETWAKLADFVSRCHAKGLKVRGYMQTRSIYYETFGNEVEDWKSWAALNRDGSMQFFGRTYYRCAPCLSSPDYAQYVREVITDGVKAIGFDGIHMDNSYYQHCWCSRCAERFRDFLGQQEDFEENVGIPLSRHVEPPPVPAKGAMGLDPLQIFWLRFGVETRIGFFRTLRQHLAKELPGLVVSGNPAFPRGDAALIARCVDPSREAEAFDFLCCENSNQPRIENGWIASQAEAHLLAEAGNYKIWITSWKSVPEGVEPPHAPGGIWAGLAEEYSFGGTLGNNWALRPAGDHGKFFSEEAPEMIRTFREAVAFFRKVEEQTSPGPRGTFCDVAILHDPFSVSLHGTGEIRLNLALQQYLLKTGIPYRIIYPGQNVPKSVNTLVVFHTGAISDPHLDWIKSFAAQPGHVVWLAGNSAQNDEWSVPRNRSDLETLRREPGITFTPAFGATWQKAFLHPLTTHAHRPSGYFEAEGIYLREEDWGAFHEFFSSPAFRPTLRFTRPTNVMVHTQQTEDGRILIHFRDQAGGTELVDGVAVQFEEGFPSVVSASFTSPDSDLADLEPAGTITLPPFRHYALLILKVASLNLKN